MRQPCAMSDTRGTVFRIFRDQHCDWMSAKPRHVTDAWLRSGEEKSQTATNEYVNEAGRFDLSSLDLNFLTDVCDANWIRSGVGKFAGTTAWIEHAMGCLKFRTATGEFVFWDAMTREPTPECKECKLFSPSCKLLLSVGE